LDTWIGRDKRTPTGLSGSPLHELSTSETAGSTVELCTNSRHDLPQLATTETPVELPSDYGFHDEIGKAI
jgi:hypothetical protein